MSEKEQPERFPELREHKFTSNAPVVGPLIQVIRREIYGLAAKWGILSVINQQNQINALIAQRLQEYEDRLIDQDRDITRLTKNLAEMEIRQKHLMKHIPNLDKSEPR
jgi:hypothetical protein